MRENENQNGGRKEEIDTTVKRIVDMEEDGSSPEEAEERGDTWRSRQVYECAICGTETNKWILGGYPGAGPRLLCPARDTEEHSELEKLHQRKKEVETRIELYDREKETDILSNLREEIEIIEESVSDLRESLSEGYDDVERVGEKTERMRFQP
jgi:hypothetical protein